MMATETIEPATQAELRQRLLKANAEAFRLRGTVYWARAHAEINDLLDQIVGR